MDTPKMRRLKRAMEPAQPAAAEPPRTDGYGNPDPNGKFWTVESRTQAAGVVTEPPVPELDKHGYPSEDQLEAIKRWPLREVNDRSDYDFDGLMAYAHELWNYPDYWDECECLDDEHGQSPKRFKRYTISTGGWGGAEDVIEALGRNALFWHMCWVQTRRGGHYIFEVPESYWGKR